MGEGLIEQERTRGKYGVNRKLMNYVLMVDLE